MKKTITFLAILTVMISTIVISAEVFGGKWNSSPQYYVSTTNVYYSNVNSGASRWNTQLAAINANISIQTTTLINASVLVTTSAYGDIGWNALTSIGPNRDSGYYSYGSIKLNSTYMYNYTSAKRSAICTHEWGHILGIAHTMSDDYESLMFFLGSSIYYDQWGVYSPTPYDIDTLNSIY